jgi:hypothetical protein
MASNVTFPGLSNNIRLHSLSLHEIRINSDGLHSISFTEKTPEVCRHLRRVALYLYIEIFQDLSWQIKFEKCLSSARELESLEITSEPSENRSNLTTLFHTIWVSILNYRLIFNLTHSLHSVKITKRAYILYICNPFVYLVGPGEIS